MPEVQLYQSCLFKKRAGDEATNWHSDLHTSPLDTNDFVTCWFPLHDLEADSTGALLRDGVAPRPRAAHVVRARV